MNTSKVKTDGRSFLGEKEISLVKRTIIQTGPLWSLLVLVVLLSICSNLFLTAGNIINVVRQVVITAVLGIGVTFVIIGGGIDLSIGAVLAFSGAISASVMVKTNSVFLSIVIGLLVGAVIGLVQGLIITKGKVAPFAITLGGMSVFRGLTLVYLNGIPITGMPKDYRFLGAGDLGPVPAPIVCAAVVFIICLILLNKTRLGRYIYAMGSNEQATRLTGINVDFFRTITYVISGTCAALAGIIMTGRINSAHPQAGSGYELIAIAGVVIGGTSINGGEGKLYGTIIGAMIIGIIQNGLNLLSVSAFWQDVAVGIVIVIAVLIDRFRTKISK